MASFQDIAARERHQIEPTQRLRLLMWEAVGPLSEYMDQAGPSQSSAYRAVRRRIEAEFAAIHDAVRSDPELGTLVERARDDWTAADRIGVEVISVQRPPGDPRGAHLLETFQGRVAASVDKLGAVYDRLAADLRQDHDLAMLSDERSEWLASLAAAFSALMILIGVAIIGRVMTVSVDRLVAGAARFGAGDREHQIEVEVPPELNRVAAEFNRMIGRVHDAEEALADLARRDGLTGLLNRRAFDEALNEAFSRMQRFGERVALLMIDIDHFKRINDTHGHSVGDDVLRAVARTMAPDVRLFDRVFRIGGEEFAVLLFGPDVTSAQATAERLREAISVMRVRTEAGEIDVTVSIGVATAAESSAPSTLVEDADAALYRAKSDGRNRVVFAVGAAPSQSGRADSREKRPVAVA